MKFFIHSSVTLAVFSWILSGCASLGSYSKAPSDACHERRAAFDVGSGTTRMQIADVDICLDRIERVVVEKEEKIDFKEDLSHSKTSEFSNEILAQAEGVFARFHEIAEAAHVADDRQVGVATSAFRDAKNASRFVKALQTKWKISLHVISTEEEGLIGFSGALSASALPAEKIVVWDIGGGSQQLTFMHRGRLLSQSIPLGSVAFKNEVIEKAQKSDPKTKKSPNPLTERNILQALNIAERGARKGFSSSLKDSLLALVIHKKKGVTVVGIGGVHSGSLKSQLKKDLYTRDDILKELRAKTDKTDEEVGGKYASTDVTNLALVLGVMKAVGIREVKAMKINNTSGLLLARKFWPRSRAKA